MLASLMSALIAANPIPLECESGTLAGGMVVGTALSGYSGTGYVDDKVEGAATSVTLPFSIAEAGLYSIVLRYQTYGGEKGVEINIDGTTSTPMLPEAAVWDTTELAQTQLSAGSHTLKLGSGWHWFALDKITIAPASNSSPFGQLGPIDPASYATKPIPDAEAGSYLTLANPNATSETKGLIRFLSALYGRRVLSGHQASYTWATAESELAQIKSWTGESPATRGFDFMDVINSWGAPHATNALAWAQSEGGIVQLCWHWRLGGAEFYSDKGTSMPADPETDATIGADLKKLGDELQKFADAKIPVLWRPLHEPPGKWFWWHTGGAEPYKKLWIRMYKYLVNDRKLNNLIWVYSSSDGGYTNTQWYPGNDYVDIVGVDGYGANWLSYWKGMWSMTGGGKKMIAMTENQAIPPWNEASPWLWTLSWNDEIFQKLTSNDFKTHYNHANTINLDNMPTAKNASTGKARTTWDKMIPTSSSVRSFDLASSSISLRTVSNGYEWVRSEPLATAATIRVIDTKGRELFRTQAIAGAVSGFVPSVGSGLRFVVLESAQHRDIRTLTSTR